MRRGQRAAHRWMSYAMAAAIAAILLLAWAASNRPSDAPAPERLSPPGSASLIGGGEAAS